MPPRKPRRPFVDTRDGLLVFMHDGPARAVFRLPGVDVLIPYTVTMYGRTFDRTVFTLCSLYAN